MSNKNIITKYSQLYIGQGLLRVLKSTQSKVFYIVNEFYYDNLSNEAFFTLYDLEDDHKHENFAQIDLDYDKFYEQKPETIKILYGRK